MNVVSLVGTVGRPIELEHTRGGTAACRVVLGVDRPHTRDVTDWVRCQAYGKTAEWLARWMHKGDRLGLTGCLCCDAWTDRQGQRQHMWYVLIDRAEFVERKRQQQAVGTAYQGPDGVEYEEVTADEQVPF